MNAIRRVKVLALMLAAICAVGCAGRSASSGPVLGEPVRTVELPRDDAIALAALREQMRSGPMGQVHYVGVDYNDPSPAVIDRLRDEGFHVEPQSVLTKTDDYPMFWHGGVAVDYEFASSFKFQDDGSVLVTIGCNRGPLSGGGSTLRLKRLRGTWSVVEIVDRWIS